MKLARFIADGGEQLGVVREDDIVTLATLSRVPQDMQSLIADWTRCARLLRAALDQPSTTIPLQRVRLLAPIKAPQKIMAIGLNYADHIEETGMATPTEPLWFAKMPGTINDPFGDIAVPRVSEQLDHEVELVAVVGDGGRHISEAEAPSRVFGYCVGNDVSVRDWQLRTSQWVLGKSFDGHGPIGPWIVTADEIPDPHSLDIRCFVNDEQRQSSNTRHLVFNIWNQIAWLSQAMRLAPGDLVYTGTPGGVGVARKPPIWLRAGDRVRCEIDAIGAIENTVVDE